MKAPNIGTLNGKTVVLDDEFFKKTKVSDVQKVVCATEGGVKYHPFRMFGRGEDAVEKLGFGNQEIAK